MSGDPLAAFIGKWTHPGSSPEPMPDGWRSKVEAALGVRLPDALAASLSRYGRPAPTIALLHSITENDLYLSDVADFLVPEDMISSTQSGREMGLAPEFAAFANDCMGNLFCVRSDDAAIWRFDHDPGDTRQETDSFDAWIEAFNAVPFVDPDE